MPSTYPNDIRCLGQCRLPPHLSKQHVSGIETVCSPLSLSVVLEEPTNCPNPLPLKEGPPSSFVKGPLNYPAIPGPLPGPFGGIRPPAMMPQKAAKGATKRLLHKEIRSLHRIGDSRSSLPVSYKCIGVALLRRPSRPSNIHRTFPKRTEGRKKALLLPPHIRSSHFSSS